MKISSSERKMSLESLNEQPILMNCKELKRVGRAVSSLLSDAVYEDRVTCGLRPAIKALDRDPQHVLCCVVPQTRPGDAAFHIQTTLLQAFCYEHSIAIIKVDSVERLRELVRSEDCSCVLVHRDSGQLYCPDLSLILEALEITHTSPPVFKLPAK